MHTSVHASVIERGREIGREGDKQRETHGDIETRTGKQTDREGEGDISMCLCVYVHAGVCTYVYIYARIYTNIHTYIHACSLTYTYRPLST